MKIKFTLIVVLLILVCIQSMAQVVRVSTSVTFEAGSSSCSGGGAEMVVAQEITARKGQAANSTQAGCSCAGTGDVVNYTQYGVNGNFPALGDFTGKATYTTSFGTIGVNNSAVYYQTRNVKWWYKAGFGCIHDILSTSSPSYQTIYVEAALTFTPPSNLCANGAPVDLLPLTNKAAGQAKNGMTYTIDGGASIPIATLLDPSTLSVGPHTIAVTYPFYQTPQTISKNVTINAIPTSTIQATFPENVCAISGDAYDLNGHVTNPIPAGSSISFSCVAGGSYICPSGVLNAGVFNPYAQGGNSFQSQIRVTTTGPTGCTSFVDKIINVGQNFTVSPGAAISVCKDAAPVALGGSPANGGGYTASWSGNGVVSGTHFNPALGTVIAGTPYTLTYTVNNNLGCIKTATRTATARANPVLSVGGAVPHIADCASGNLDLVATYVPKDNGVNVSTGLTWSSSNSTVNSKISGNILSLTGIPLGNYNISFTYINGNGCASTYTITNALAINTGAIEVPSASNKINCGLGLSVILSVDAPDGTISYDWYETLTGGTAISTGTSFTTPALNASKSYYVSARKASCESSRKQVNVTVVNTDVDAGPDYSSCTNTTGNVNLSGLNNPTPAGGTWSGPGVTGGNFNGSSLANNTAYELVYTINQSGCVSRDTILATLGFSVQLSYNPSNKIYPGNLMKISHNYPTATKTVWTFGDGQSLEALTGSHYYYDFGFKTITVYIKQAGGCENTFTVTDALEVLRPEVITQTEQEIIHALNVYPVPFSSDLMVNLDNDIVGVSIRMIDLSGRVVLTESGKTLHKGVNTLFNQGTGSLTPGLYVLELKNSSTIRRIKLIKQ